MDRPSLPFRAALAAAALLNLGYFGVEFGVAVAIGSVSLFADSMDFLEESARTPFFSPVSATMPELSPTPPFFPPATT